MINFTKFLEQLDLSEIEASLYTTLLDNGPMSVRDLAVLTKMKRTTAYFYIDQLIEKGLVMKLTRGTQKMVTVSQPKESLEYLVEQKSQTAETLKKEFPDMLKAINTTLPKIETNDDAEIKYYKGKTGVMKIYQEALKAKELRSYVNFEIQREALPENEFLFPEGLKKNKTIKIFEILEDSSETRKLLEEFRAMNENNDRFFHKFLPPGVKLSSVDILIYEGKVAIINVKKQITGVVLHNADYFENSKELFDLLWQIFK